MAAKAREEGDCSDAQSGYNEEEEEEEGGDYGRSGELHELRRRIAQSSYRPLSEETVRMLHTALLSLRDPTIPPPSSTPLSPLLLNELRSLKARIPPSQGDKGSTSCVISQALNYLDQMNTILKGLKEDMQELMRDTLKDGMSSSEG